MRYAQLLLEFDVAMTVDQMGSKLQDRLTEICGDLVDRIKTVAPREYGVPPRAAFISPEDRKGIQRYIHKQCVEMVIAYDPTPNHSYSRWLCQRIVDRGIPLWDDMDKAERFLANFDRLKKGGYFRRNPAAAHLADIGRFKTLTDLGEFLMSIPDTDALSNAGQERALEKKMIEEGDVRILLDTDRFRVVVPNTAEAATHYGRNTQWCTTMSNGNHFAYYSKQGPLYIILDKPNNRRWQFHYETGQMMDENDRQIMRMERDERDRFEDGPWKEKAVYDNFPMEFFDVIPGEMMLRGPKTLPEGKINWRRVQEDDFTHLPQNALLEIVKTVQAPSASRTAVKFMDIKTKAIMYRLGVSGHNRDYYWFTTAVLGDLQKAEVNVVETESQGLKCVSGNLLDLLIYDLKTDRMGGEDIWTLAPVDVQGLRSFEPAWTNCGLVYGKYSTVLAQDRHRVISYIVIDEDGLFDEKIHGLGAAWIQTSREKLAKDGRAGWAKGLSNKQALAICDMFSVNAS